MKPSYCRVRVEWLIRNDFNETRTLATTTLSFPPGSIDYQRVAEMAVEALLPEKDRQEAHKQIADSKLRGEVRIKQCLVAEGREKERRGRAEEDATYLERMGHRLQGQEEGQAKAVRRSE